MHDLFDLYYISPHQNLKEKKKKKFQFHKNHLIIVFKKVTNSYYILGDFFMYNLVKRYMENLSVDQVNDFAQKNNVFLSESELNFTYTFVK